MEKRSAVPHDVPILDSDSVQEEDSGTDIEFRNDVSSTKKRNSRRASKLARGASPVRMYDQTDEERMQEALAKYEGNPYVMEIKPIRMGRDDGSTYIAPIIFVKPDLTIGSLVFPGSRGGSAWGPTD